MARAHRICLPLCLAACAAGLAGGIGAARADNPRDAARGPAVNKPKMAVLGLEVQPGPGGTIDPGAVLIAKEVTRELRQRMQSPACPYVLAPNSNKELLDEKLLMSCDSEGLDCMVLIGVALASDAMLYGKVEKRSESFRVSLKLLDVHRRQIQPAVDDSSAGGGVAGVVRRLYRKLIGDGPISGGSLVVRARSETGAPLRGGSVILDDEVRGTLTNGKLAVTGVPEGRHTVAISVGGFRRHEEMITVRGGEQATVEALLRQQSAMPEPIPSVGAPPPEEPARTGPSPIWKVSLIAGAAVAVGGAGYIWYTLDKQQTHAGNVRANINNDRCDESDASLLATNPQMYVPAFRRACFWTTRNRVAFGIAGLGAVTAVVSLIMMSRDPDRRYAVAAGHRGGAALAVAPLVGPDFAGAQLAGSW